MCKNRVSVVVPKLDLKSHPVEPEPEPEQPTARSAAPVMVSGGCEGLFAGVAQEALVSRSAHSMPDMNGLKLLTDEDFKAFILDLTRMINEGESEEEPIAPITVDTAGAGQIGDVGMTDEMYSKLDEMNPDKIMAEIESLADWFYCEWRLQTIEDERQRELPQGTETLLLNYDVDHEYRIDADNPEPEAVSKSGMSACMPFLAPCRAGLKRCSSMLKKKASDAVPLRKRPGATADRAKGAGKAAVTSVSVTSAAARAANIILTTAGVGGLLVPPVALTGISILSLAATVITSVTAARASVSSYAHYHDLEKIQEEANLQNATLNPSEDFRQYHDVMKVLNDIIANKLQKARTKVIQTIPFLGTIEKGLGMLNYAAKKVSGTQGEKRAKIAQILQDAYLKDMPLAVEIVAALSKHIQEIDQLNEEGLRDRVLNTEIKKRIRAS